MFRFSAEREAFSKSAGRRERSRRRRLSRRFPFSGQLQRWEPTKCATGDSQGGVLDARQRGSQRPLSRLLWVLSCSETRKYHSGGYRVEKDICLVNPNLFNSKGTLLYIFRSAVRAPRCIVCWHKKRSVSVQIRSVNCFTNLALKMRVFFFYPPCRLVNA